MESVAAPIVQGHTVNECQYLDLDDKDINVQWYTRNTINNKRLCTIPYHSRPDGSAIQNTNEMMMKKSDKKPWDWKFASPVPTVKGFISF
jgi:hypothetical protein